MAITPVQGKQIATASWAINAISSSYSATASYALNAGGTTINTGSFVTTSSFNSFTSSYNTGSFTGSFTGSLLGTASFAVSSSRAITSSFAISASQAQNAVSASYSLSSSFAITASNLSGFSAATVDQTNVGETNSGDYAYIIRAQELEQSKHTTINIYNNLNFT
jgi:hypothetical protein